MFDYKSSVKKLAEELDCTLEVAYPGTSETEAEILIEAPHGYHFVEGIHEMVFSTWDDDTIEDLWRAAWKRFSEGQLVECDDECEWWS